MRRVAHREQLKFFMESARLLVESGRTSLRILEVGSCDVNGSIREILSPITGTYLGVDLAVGPNVDLVIAPECRLSDLGTFDLIVSAEALEHDPGAFVTVNSMCDALASDGLLLISAASKGRPEHGTARSGAFQSPGTSSIGINHYENIDANKLQSALELHCFEHLEVTYNWRTFDVYALASRTTAFGQSGWVRRAAKSWTPLYALAARAPLYVWRFLPSRIYQPLAFRYWRAVSNVAGSLRTT